MPQYTVTWQGGLAGEVRTFTIAPQLGGGLVAVRHGEPVELTEAVADSLGRKLHVKPIKTRAAKAAEED